ncbi:hypothetical protein COB72_07755 [bacterium]|nr:MAG: hypothetical protein COB72_07755 [bacterium]
MQNQRTKTQRFILAAAGFAIATGSLAQADIFEVESFHLGGFYAVPDGEPPLIPDNDLTFQNYFMGHTTIPTIPITTTERRTFFAFDLADVLIPDGHEIIGVEFELELIFGGILANFEGGTEEVIFTSTTSDYDTFMDPLASGLGPDEIFDSMGTGDFYTGVGFDTMTIPDSITMDMSEAAIEDILDSMLADSPFMITGMLATYDPEASALFEFVFGLSDVVTGGSPTGFPVPKLTITTAPVPAPAGILVLGSGLMCSMRRRR